MSVIPEKSKCAQVGITFSCLLTLTPSDGFAATLAKAKRLTHFYSVAPLLEKWFACFPTSGDGIRFPFCRFLQKPSKNFEETQFTLPSFLSGG